MPSTPRSARTKRRALPRLRPVRGGTTGGYDDRMDRSKPAQSEATLEDALCVAVEAHRGQIYPAPEPEPFILHPLRVMLRVTSKPARIVALIHDVVEDSEFTLHDLAERGFDSPVLDAVDCLSRRPDEEYGAYISRVASHPDAREVKLSDLEDNLEN